ncbi:MAG: T9SS type A sorting domain-containing protein [Flavobacteriales bacterium]
MKNLIYKTVIGFAILAMGYSSIAQCNVTISYTASADDEYCDNEILIIMVVVTGESDQTQLDYSWELDGDPIAGPTAGNDTIYFNWNPPNASDTYNLEVTVDNGGCTDDNEDVDIEINAINDPAIPIITATTTPLCQDEIDTFTAASTGATAYSWTFTPAAGTGTGASTSTLTMNWTDSYTGSANIVVTASNECASVASLLYTTSVQVAPDAAFTITDDVQCFTGNSFDFNSADNSGTHTWSFGTGGPANSASTDPQDIPYSNCGLNKSVQHIIDLSGCNDTVTHTVDVLASPAAAFTYDSSICEDQSTDFDGSTSSVLGGCGGVIIYSWSIGGGNTATPTTMFPTCGNQDVTLTTTITTQGVNCIDAETQSVTVNPTPVASFSLLASDDEIQCNDNDLFHFINNTPTLGCGGTINYQWQVNNANNSTSEDLTISFDDVDEYNIELIATSNLGCSTSDMMDVEVIANPVINPIVLTNDTPPSDAYCVGDDINMSVTVVSPPNVNPNNVTWTLPDMTTQTGLSIVVSDVATSQTGTYSVNVSAGGCGTGQQTEITIHPNPVANAASNSPICEGESINFTESNTGLAHSWTGSEFTTANTTQNPIVNGALPTYTNAVQSDTYTVTITDANNCSNAQDLLVIVHPNPEITSNAPIDQELCADEWTTAVNFSGIPNTVVFNWSIDEDIFYTLSTTGQGNIPSDSLLNTGINPVDAVITITPSANGCDAANTQSFTISANPVPQFVAIVAPGVICQGAQNLFYSVSSTSSDAGTYTYDWFSNEVDFTTNAQGTNATADEIPSQGSFDIEVTATNAFNCTTSEVQTVDISNNAAPIPGNVILFGIDSTALVLDIADNGLQFQWGCIDASTLEAQEFNGASYQQLFQSAIGIWDFEGKDYYVRIIGQDGCETINIYLDSDPIDVNEVDFPVVSLYPIPASEQLIIQSNLEIVCISMYDMWGKLVLWEVSKTNYTSSRTIGLNELSNGVYVVFVQMNNGSSIQQRIIKQR